MVRATAAAFVLQATPWVPLVVRRGSSAEVSVKIPLEDEEDDDHETPPPAKANGVGRATSDRTRCLVWQFRIEEYDIAFQIVENGRPIQDLVRHSAIAASDMGTSEAEATTSKTADSSTAVVSAAAASVVSAEGVVLAATRGSVYTFRWDNTYSIVRHKRVFYRFVVTSTRAVQAAEMAADETQQRLAQPKTEPNVSVKPHLAKRLALERRLTVDEISLEQTRAIQQLQRCVTDMVAMFMTDPDRPLHEGSIREFLLSLEAVLRNGIKEKYLRAWPEEPYFEFLLQIESVLRDDKQLVADVKALPAATKLQYLGWTRARALLLLALNRNMLHYAFENLIKRRAVVETYYDTHGLLYMYNSATQIVAYLSALNGVKFLLAMYPDETFLSGIEHPANLKQCAPNDEFEGDFVTSGRGATGYILRTEDSDSPDLMKTIEQCSVARHLLATQEVKEVTIARGVEESILIAPAKGDQGLCMALQLRVVPGEIAISLAIADADESNEVEFVVEPFILSPVDGWVDVLLVSESAPVSSLELLFDNSNAIMRARQVAYRMRVVPLAEFDVSWEACQGMAQSISWKIATKAGVERCQARMEGLQLQQQMDVAEQQQRSREASGSHDNGTVDGAVEDDTLFGMGASLITKPVSFLVGGFLGLDGDSAPASCSQCLTPFSFFSRQYQCPSCQSVVCIPCSRHIAQINGKGPEVKLCDRCFIKEKDAEKKRRAALASASTNGGECAAYAALREDPTMEKYFKMLSFGVPHSGVAQKMLQDEMPSDKIIIFSAGPAGVTEDDTGQSATKQRNSGGRAGGSGSHRGNAFRKVHWKSLETKKATGSIWNRETSRRKTAPIRIAPQDYQEIVLLFGRDASGSGGDGAGTKPSGGNKKQLFSALDSRRSNNIAIGLSQFKAVGGADTILKSLKECDFDFLTSDRLSNIYEIAPTSVETKRYTNFRGSRSRLEPAEKFLVDMCEIPRVTEKIAAMRFVAQFESQHRELRHRIRLINQACYQVLQSERLARCFELVLAIGNLLNSGTEIENSGGVTLESLLKLSETKSIDQSMTLLHFIVRLIHDRGESDVLMFIQDLSVIAEAKRFSNVICLSQAKLLQSGVTQAQSEIKEEMLTHAKTFEKAEEMRRRRHEQEVHARSAHHSHAVNSESDSEATSEPNPRAALMEMLRKRNQAGLAESSPSTVSQPPEAVSERSGRSALFAAIRNRQKTPDEEKKEPESNKGSGTDQAQDMNNPAGATPQRHALLSAIRNRASNSVVESSENASTDGQGENPRTAMLTAIKRKSHSLVNGSMGADSSSPQTSPTRLPPRANLLSAIRARGSTRDQRNGELLQPKSERLEHSEYKPRVYSVDDNKFITVMRKRVMGIKATMEELEMDVETLVSMWESTARYLGEDPLSSSSEYVLQLLNRFVLDVKIAKTLLSRQGLSFQSMSLGAQVGSVVATKYGPGVVTAIRGDEKLEVAFPWSRESYLSPSSILSVGAVVRCRTFGIGVLRSTHYDRGFCQVRFHFGLGIIRVGDLQPDASSAANAIKKEILSGGFRLGDPVITPFGRGSVRSVPQGLLNTTSQELTRHGDSIVVNLLVEGEEDYRPDSPVAFVQVRNVKMNY